MTAPTDPTFTRSSFGEVRRALLEWFPTQQRKLPWRGQTDPYAIWVSEVMLQQTQAAAVIPHFVRFMEEFPTVQALAAAPLDTVLRLWSGLGYYSRARNLHRAARLVAEHHGGRIPHDLPSLRALPGIGEYTAGAILSIAFGQPTPAIDGNVRRVLCRAYGIQGSPEKGQARRQLRTIACALVDGPNPGEVNQALMELGAMVCVPTRPLCHRCPIAGLCQALATGRQRDLPQARRRSPTVQRRTVAAVIRRGTEVLLARRPEKGVWGGLWEFPQTESQGARLTQSLVQHVQQALGLVVQPEQSLAHIRHTLMNQIVTLQVVECRLLRGRLRPSAYTAARWLPLDQLDDYPLSSPHRAIARLLSAPDLQRTCTPGDHIS